MILLANPCLALPSGSPSFPLPEKTGGRVMAPAVDPSGPHSCPPPIISGVDLRIFGPIDLSLYIRPDGAVENVTIEHSSGSDEGDMAAVKCVSAWRYKPSTQDGKPVEVPWNVRVDWSHMKR